jgi:hypothetical protein
MSTFTEYKESLQAREEVAAAVLRHTEELCEVLEQNFVEDSIKRAKFFGAGNPEYREERLRRLQQGKDRYKFYIESGRKYHKIIMETDDGNRSVHAFVDKKTGEVYKAASYKAPAKIVRFDLRIIEQRQWLFDNADWAGAYLYIR